MYSWLVPASIEIKMKQAVTIKSQSLGAGLSKLKDVQKKTNLSVQGKVKKRAREEEDARCAMAEFGVDLPKYAKG